MTEWLKRIPEPWWYWTIQAASILTAIVMAWAAMTDEARGRIIIDASLAGFCVSNVLHNFLHRRRNRAMDAMIQLADGQQTLLREVMAMKSHEVAKEIAAKMGMDIVSIEGPDGPIAPPTKH